MRLAAVLLEVGQSAHPSLSCLRTRALSAVKLAAAVGKRFGGAWASILLRLAPQRRSRAALHASRGRPIDLNAQDSLVCPQQPQSRRRFHSARSKPTHHIKPPSRAMVRIAAMARRRSLSIFGSLQNLLCPIHQQVANDFVQRRAAFPSVHFQAAGVHGSSSGMTISAGPVGASRAVAGGPLPKP